MPTISAANAVKGVGGFVKSVAYQEDEIASIPYKCRLNSGQSKGLPTFVGVRMNPLPTACVCLYRVRYLLISV
jgi:hypothetical protein